MTENEVEYLEETLPWRYKEVLTTHVTEGFDTISHHLDDIAEKTPNGVLYKWRSVKKYHIEKDMRTRKSLVTVEYTKEKTLTCKQVHEMVYALERGILQFEPELKPQSRIGVYANSCKEWAMAFHAITNMSMTVTTVYATLGWESLVGCINEAELSVIFCEASNVENIDIHLGGGKCPKLKKLIVIGDEVKYRSKKFEMKTMYELMVSGSKLPKHTLPKPKYDDIAVLMYTSGTTGTPKGVMIRHGNILASMSAFTTRLECKKNRDTHLSYLPMAHIFELGLYSSILANYGTIAFGNPRTLIAKPGGAKYLGDLAWAKPTLLGGVPKVWETIKKGVVGKVRKAGGVKQMLFNWVMSKKEAILKKKGENQDVFLEATVFKKVRELVGGRLRYIISGGAPLNPDTHYFLCCVMGSGCKIIQGYGLTETAAAGLTNLLRPEKITVGNVGFPTSCSEVKLVSCKEMGYIVSKDEGGLVQGEILLRGPSITAGYFKRPEQTREAYDEDGWFHTGDIGEKHADGRLSIIDRKKNLVKLQHGEYIPIESIEVKYLNSEFIQPNGMFLHCDPMENHVVAVIMPDISFAFDFAQKNNIMKGGTTIEEIINHPKYLNGLASDLQRISKSEKMRWCETLDIKKFVVRNDIWTPQNGCLTAAMKLKRRSLLQRYQKDMDMLYKGDGNNNIIAVKSKKDEEEGEEEEEVEGEIGGLSEEEKKLMKKKKFVVPEFFKSVKSLYD